MDKYTMDNRVKDVAALQNAARVMLAMLKETLDRTDWAMSPDFYDRMEAAIKAAEKAGIATGEE